MRHMSARHDWQGGKHTNNFDTKQNYVHDASVAFTAGFVGRLSLISGLENVKRDTIQACRHSALPPIIEPF